MIDRTMASRESASAGTQSRTERPGWSSTKMPQISVSRWLICK
jgi:hypothetical protein